MTFFRVHNWITRIIRVAGRELCWRRDFLRHSHPASHRDTLPFFVFPIWISRRHLLNYCRSDGRRVRLKICTGAGWRKTASISLILPNFLSKWLVILNKYTSWVGRFMASVNQIKLFFCISNFFIEINLFSSKIALQ